MKHKYILLVACAALCLNACKRDSSNVQGGPIIGKWQEIKLNLHQQTLSKPNDTTFTASAFKASDYYQFNRDNTAIISQSGIYSFAGKSEVINGGTYAVGVGHFRYKTMADSVLILTSTDKIPTALTGSSGAPMQSLTIVQADDTHLVLRTNYNYPATPQSNENVNPAVVATAYFTRVE